MVTKGMKEFLFFLMVRFLSSSSKMEKRLVNKSYHKKIKQNSSSKRKMQRAKRRELSQLQESTRSR